MNKKEMPICVNCFHAYVCEKYNLNRDMLRKRCAYYNDHFFDIEQHEKKVRKETAKEIINEFVLSPRTRAMIAEKYGLSKEDLGEL